MENLQKIIESLNLNRQISLNEIPEIDLYMDQVIQLFENKFSSTKRNEDEKVLTKTMINNYAKGKLLFPIKNKKYSKDHLILISLIYQLKGGLSINDIKDTLSNINAKIIDHEFEVDRFYDSFLHLTEKNLSVFYNDAENKVEDVKHEVKLLEDSASGELEKILMIASFVHMSNLYRRTAERLIDELGEKKN
ncbi:DUF1836 domain-containing protein [Bacillus sp. DTU_2020_1000418_1_SI_GHA_SEK_038]|uniref:DUF1836 domain-containing protein n=1 Tax=Bacillus sp. DTU_2020_1000418_1_SI_GHA_SEK_038 TaxID=3077585 RepID=UPI0028E51EE9|nr:DUF1836 domain-containing protein [Bacillus sp. DTU_2020_1000418_1_SI_GHA_SEK_038]WNS73583.1 DUF1836 domain-containing protein [Bacillus sp. DTU_2020_1000418_1_SI_GHA_SEK_038]